MRKGHWEKIGQELGGKRVCTTRMNKNSEKIEDWRKMGLRLELKGVNLGEKWGLDE